MDFILFLGQERPEDVGLPPFVDEVTKDGEHTEAGRPWSEVEHRGDDGPTLLLLQVPRYAADSWGQQYCETSSKATARLSRPDIGALFLIGWVSSVSSWVVMRPINCSAHAGCQWSSMTTLMFLVAILMALLGQRIFIFYHHLGLLGFAMMGLDSLLSGTAAMDISTREKAVVASAIINGLGSAA